MARFVDVVHHCFQGFPSTSAEVYHYLHVQAVHLPDQEVEILGAHAPVMAVNIHKGDTGRLGVMFRYHQGGNRVVVFKTYGEAGVNFLPLGA